ncbi:MAG: shikimate kinase [Candidatus Nitrospinota bacterium M3_3B_026]
MKTSGPVIVIGFKGCGKSTVGAALAEKLGRKFIDTDDIIERLHEERTGEVKNFREIFKSLGRERFRELEDEAARIALKERGAVISLGGGTLMGGGIEKTENAVFIHIKVDERRLFERIMKGGLPAFLDENDPEGSFRKVFRERAAMYEKYADIAVDNTDRRPEDAAEEIVKLISRNANC